MSLFPRFTQEFSPLFRLLDDYDRQVFQNFDKNVRTFSPKFDVKETPEAYELSGEFPGIDQKNINIEWTDANTLTVSGRHETVREEGSRPQGFIEEGKAKQPTVEDENATSNTEFAAPADNQVAKKFEQQDVAKKDNNETKYWVSERSVGEFHRTFSFPARIDQDAVKASLKNGILSVIVPKAKALQPKKVNIE